MHTFFAFYFFRDTNAAVQKDILEKIVKIHPISVRKNAKMEYAFLMKHHINAIAIQDLAESTVKRILMTVAIIAALTTVHV